MSRAQGFITDSFKETAQSIELEGLLCVLGNIPQCLTDNYYENLGMKLQVRF